MLRVIHPEPANPMRSLLASAAVLLSVPAAAQTVSTETLKEVTRTLASDEFEGRAPGTAGEEKTLT